MHFITGGILPLVLGQSCPVVTPPNHAKIVNEPFYTSGSTITFECDPGYSMIGSDILTCVVNGTWDTQLPTCVTKLCGHFDNIPNGTTTQKAENGIVDSYNSIVEVNCNRGFILNGRKNVRCQADGTWESKPTCKVTMCPPYPGLSSACVNDARFANSELYIQCRDDVKVTRIGGESTTCSDDGQWEDLSLACHCDCKLDDTPDSVILANLDEQGYLGHNETLEWVCKKGFTENASISIKCEDGKVNGLPNCMEVTDNTTIIIASIIGGIGLIVVIGVLVCIVICRRRTKSKSEKSPEHKDAEMSMLHGKTKDEDGPEAESKSPEIRMTDRGVPVIHSTQP